MKLGRTKNRDINERIVSVLDIGTSKVCCMIVALDAKKQSGCLPGDPLSARLLGYGELRANGIKAGVVIDLAKAGDVVRKVIARAEEMAERQIEDIVIAVSCGRIASTNFTASTEVLTSQVTDSDVARVFRAGRDFAMKDGRTLLHLNGLGFGVDGSDGIAEPRGLKGHRLSADIHAVTADDLPLRNLTALIDRCYLDVSRLVAAPYAGALAAITDEEARLGVLCVDIGGGTTSMAVFAEGHFIHTDAFAIGGSNITHDIARTLSTPIEEAERLKTLHGNLVVAASDDHEIISYPVIDQDEVGLYQISRSELRGLIEPRVSEIFQLIRERLDASGMTPFTSDHLVLTGGGSALAGLQDFAENKLDMHTRIAGPGPIADAPENLRSPGYSVVFGLLRAVSQRDRQFGTGPAPDLDGSATVQRSYFGQMGKWLRESLWDDDQDSWSTGT
jgi:cell division protein FtsA